MFEAAKLVKVGQETFGEEIFYMKLCVSPAVRLFARTSSPYRLPGLSLIHI